MPTTEQPSLFDNQKEDSASAQIGAVPYWATRSVILFSELSQATSAQQKFYQQFKTAFLNGQSINPEGNLNYLFLLIQDLYQGYTQHQDARLFTRQLKTLIRQYPEGKAIAERLYEARFPMFPPLSSLEKEEIPDDWDSYLLLFANQSNPLSSVTKYNLRLTSSQLRTLDGINLRLNVFTQNEPCFRYSISLFFSVLNEMRNRCLNQGEPLGKKIVKFAQSYIHSQTKEMPDIHPFESRIQKYQNILLTDILHRCEDQVRILYLFPIRQQTESTILNPEITQYYQDWLYPLVDEAITQKTHEIPKPTKQIERNLNLSDKNRWKIKLNILLKEEPGRIQNFEWVKSYGELVPGNKKAEYYNYLFQLSASVHPIIALEYYLQHRSIKLSNNNTLAKPIPKSFSKKIFASPEQEKAFNQILDKFNLPKQLNESISAMRNLFKLSRRKIELDRSDIQHIQIEHSETVTLLNHYLLEEEVEIHEKPSKINQTKLEANVGKPSTFQIPLSKLQEEVIQLINEHNNCLPEAQLENYIRSRGGFMHALIESINETCYEILEENLIEEQEGNYVIHASQLRQIQLRE